MWSCVFHISTGLKQSVTTRGVNLLLSGLISAANAGELGWNTYAKGELLTLNQTMVTFLLGRKQAVLTLPPLPLFNPDAEEEISITIPGSYTKSITIVVFVPM